VSDRVVELNSTHSTTKGKKERKEGKKGRRKKGRGGVLDLRMVELWYGIRV
jgi:hypothetical protein